MAQRDVEVSRLVVNVIVVPIYVSIVVVITGNHTTNSAELFSVKPT